MLSVYRMAIAKSFLQTPQTLVAEGLCRRAVRTPSREVTGATVALAQCLQGLARCTITRLVLTGQACRAPQIQ
jgi:hypothetical protein